MNNYEEPVTALAFDLGASGGKALIGQWAEDKLTVREVHRFSNTPVFAGEVLYWDILRLLHEIKQGILKAKQLGFNPTSIGIDTWGNDFGLLSPAGELLGNPIHYRDSRTDGIQEELKKAHGKAYIFEKTGIQFLPFNTIYQLYSMKRTKSLTLKEDVQFLMIPDLLRYFLTGVIKNEFTNMTTTQLYNPTLKSWDPHLLQMVGMSADNFPEMVYPGTYVGSLLPSVCKELNIHHPISVIAVGEHDTASAVVSVPSTCDDFAYISCGTWSLIGTEVPHPILSPEALAWNFTNEGGVEETFRLLKNVMGLWLVQECKRCWEQEGKTVSFDQLVEMAESAPAFRSLIDPDANEFLHPSNMPKTIQDYCYRTDQPVPMNEGEVIRCILESLALKYRFNLERIERLTGKYYNGIHMVGGGIQNRMLCRFTSGALARPVWAGPVEGSGIGNLLTQFIGSGHIKDLGKARMVSSTSFPVETYLPEDINDWKGAYERFYVRFE